MQLAPSLITGTTESQKIVGGTQLRKKVLLLSGPKIGRSNLPPCTFCTTSPARSFTRPDEQMGTLGICPHLLFADIYLYSLDLKIFQRALIHFCIEQTNKRFIRTSSSTFELFEKYKLRYDITNWIMARRICKFQ